MLKTAIAARTLFLAGGLLLCPIEAEDCNPNTSTLRAADFNADGYVDLLCDTNGALTGDFDHVHHPLTKRRANIRPLPSLSQADWLARPAHLSHLDPGMARLSRAARALL